MNGGLRRLARSFPGGDGCTRKNEGLGGDHDAFGRAVVRLLACEHPVTPERLASALQMTAEQVAGVLAGLADLEVDQSGNVVGWGLTLIPTPHRFRVQGQTFYTWCALDALTYPALLQICRSRLQVFTA